MLDTPEERIWATVEKLESRGQVNLYEVTVTLNVICDNASEALMAVIGELSDLVS